MERIVVDLLYLASKYHGLLIMEDLSRGFGRQGKKTIVSNNQYTHIEDMLIEKLKTNGLSRGGDILCNCRYGLIGKVQAAHTSRTCSSCGYVHRKENIDMDSLEKWDDTWHVTMCGKDFSLNVNYRGYKGRIENANIKIAEIIKNKNIKELSEKNEEKVQKIIKAALSPRKTQKKFVCPLCRYRKNADENASINIARRWIFEKEDEVRALREGAFSRDIKYIVRKKKQQNKGIPYVQLWTDYYKQKAEEWNQSN
jgi:hypothetical protein